MKRAAIYLTVLLVASGCGGGGKSDDRDLTSEVTADVVEDGSEDVEELCGELSTGGPEGEVLAGEWVGFDCSLAN